MTTHYQAVSLVEKLPWEDDYADSSDLQDTNNTHKSGLRSKLRANWIWLLHIILLSFSVSMIIAATNAKPSTLKYVKTFSAWSPAAEAVEYTSVRYNVTTEGNPFVGKGPVVDQAWREIYYDMGDQMITPSQLAALRMPDTSIRVQNPKTGEVGYRVGLEVFHHLHCLNLLRKVMYKEYYRGEGMLGTDEELAGHTAHCIEVLRLNLQCQADVGVFTLYLKDGDPLAWPELNTQHTCRNFDRIRDWAAENSVGIMDNA